MTTSETLQALQSRFSQSIRSIELQAIDPYAVVDPNHLIEICQYLRDEQKYHLLNNISGVDYLEPDAKKVAKSGFEPHLEVVYHLSRFGSQSCRLALKLILPRWQNNRDGELPEVPTVSAIWRTADWHEREIYDLVGVRFVGHPDLRRILTADDWTGHPLRKDYEFPLEYHDIRCR